MQQEEERRGEAFVNCSDKQIFPPGAGSGPRMIDSYGILFVQCTVSPGIPPGSRVALGRRGRRYFAPDGGCGREVSLPTVHSVPVDQALLTAVMSGVPLFIHFAVSSLRMLAFWENRRRIEIMKRRSLPARQLYLDELLLNGWQVYLHNFLICYALFHQSQ